MAFSAFNGSTVYTQSLTSIKVNILKLKSLGCYIYLPLKKILSSESDLTQRQLSHIPFHSPTPTTYSRQPTLG